ncbi:MAG: hypothetical protein A3G24_25380 [Betaproteobacteria bacterium RIFCSPLOWO2_12_FULL_62_13]|nr:MAG: hypothetical protein A3G24_25380 [Betaproteobacteria bacterium RIFCSPLOWO2_12_FULL_62_13]
MPECSESRLAGILFLDRTALLATAMLAASTLADAQSTQRGYEKGAGIYTSQTYAIDAAQPAKRSNNGGTTPAEVENSPGVRQINADVLHALGYTGLKVTAAIIDIGIMAGHPEFSGRVRPGYNAFDGSANVTDGNGHGTHVSGIFGAAKDGKGMFGVAYEASLLPIKVLDDRGNGSAASVAAGIQYAVNQRIHYLCPARCSDPNTLVAGHHQFAPFAINLSLGSSSPSDTIRNALIDAVNAGMVVAAAAGNDGRANPIYPARYARDAAANGQIIAVGSVYFDAAGRPQINSWSNRAGDTRDFYLVAPGYQVYSTYPKLNPKTRQYEATYATLSGTSMATPYVTGAVTLIKSGWTYLSANQVSSILFDSATDLGGDGIDEIYGRGLLNLQAALAPIGSLSAPTSRRASLPLTGTSLTGSIATGAALRAAGRAGLMQVAAFDRYGRDFQVDFAPTVSRAASIGNGLAPMLAALDSAAERTYSLDGGTMRVTYRSEATRLALGHQVGGNSGSSEGEFTVSAADTAARELTFGFSGMGAHSFGLGGELARRGEIQFISALENPYLALASRHTHFGIGLPLAGGLRLKFGTLVSDPRATAYDPALSQITGRHQSMGLAEVSGRLASALWTLGVGRLQETDSVLGTTQTGAFSFSGTAETSVVNFGMAFSPASRMTLGGQYTVGHTGGTANHADSLVLGYTDARSKGYGVFASLREAFRAGDSLTIMVSQPLRTASGALQMVAPARAAVDGSPVMASRSISLRPEGRETRAELIYLSPIDRRAKWFLGMAVRDQPDHESTAPRETTIGGGFHAVF